jgi:hypothetical protein
VTFNCDLDPGDESGKIEHKWIFESMMLDFFLFTKVYLLMSIHVVDGSSK